MRILIATLCLSSLIACQKEEAAAEPTAAEPVAVEAATAEVAPAEPTAVAHAQDGLHKVTCACSLDKGKTCGNMIEVDGRYLPLEGETGLGDMSFCGKEGLKAKVEGKVDGEKYVATALQLIEPAAK